MRSGAFFGPNAHLAIFPPMQAKVLANAAVTLNEGEKLTVFELGR